MLLLALGGFPFYLALAMALRHGRGARQGRLFHEGGGLGALAEAAEGVQTPQDQAEGEATTPAPGAGAPPAAAGRGACARPPQKFAHAHSRLPRAARARGNPIRKEKKSVACFVVVRTCCMRVVEQVVLYSHYY